MKKLIYSVLIGLISSTTYAQSSMGEIQGKIFELDSVTTIPSAHVYVLVNGNKIGAATDINGKFKIKPLNPGIYNLTVTFIGYDTIHMNGIEVSPDKITFTGNLYMGEGNFLKEIKIQYDYTKLLIDPEDTKIVTIGAKDIAKLAVRTDIAKIAQTTSSEITVSDDGNEIYFRGSREGDVIYMVDGVKTRSKPLIPSSAIHNMRVYTGGVPAKYGDMMGGVIMVETKSYFNYYNVWKVRQEMEEAKEPKK